MSTSRTVILDTPTFTPAVLEKAMAFLSERPGFVRFIERGHETKAVFDSAPNRHDANLRIGALLRDGLAERDIDTRTVYLTRYVKDGREIIVWGDAAMVRYLFPIESESRTAGVRFRLSHPDKPVMVEVLRVEAWYTICTSYKGSQVVDRGAWDDGVAKFRAEDGEGHLNIDGQETTGCMNFPADKAEDVTYIVNFRSHDGYLKGLSELQSLSVRLYFGTA